MMTQTSCATAIILAGGKSSRMGQDKALLPFMGRPLIEHVLLQVQPYFRQVLISANDPMKFAFLGVSVVVDAIPGMGPLGGIASALEASICDLNFIVACDIPVINMAFVRRLLFRAADCDCVVPSNAQGQIEPLLAVYRKCAAQTIWPALAAGQRKISDVLARCNTTYVPLPQTDSSWLDNINTARDYEELLSRQPRLHRASAARAR